MVESSTLSRLNGLRLANQEANEDLKKVLVLYTGGSLGMSFDPNDPLGGLIQIRDKLKEYCRSDPSMNDLNYQLEGGGKMDNFYILPTNENKMTRVAYMVYEYEKLIEAKNITPNDWKTIAKDIQLNFEDFDGFVIIHGTDTLAYTASALSFMFENLSKCVVLTGALKPIFDLRSDAKNNLRLSILVAGNFQIPEVTVFFRDRLLRGNRLKKRDWFSIIPWNTHIKSRNRPLTVPIGWTVRRSTVCAYGFDSLNVPPLMQVGMDIQRKEYLNNVYKRCKLTVHTKLNQNVSVLRVFPGVPVQVIRASFDHPMEGIVVQSYSTGTVPGRNELTTAIKGAIDRGAIVVTCTQCPTGSVSPSHVKGHLLSELGVIFVSDMTVEAALVKLMYVLSKKSWSLDQKKRAMAKSLRGEMTEA